MPQASQAAAGRSMVVEGARAGLVPEAITEFVRLTLGRHPQLFQVEAESRAADSRAEEARSLLRPRVSVSANTALEQQFLGATSQRNSYQQGLGTVRMTAPLLDEGLHAQLAQRKANAAGMDWKLLEAREQLVLRTIEAYIEVVRALRLLQLSHANLKMHRDYVGQVKKIAEIDIGRAADMPVALGRVSLAESVVTSRVARLETARLEFQQLTGIAGLDYLTELPLIAPADSLDQAYQLALKSSPALRTALADAESARHGINLARAPYQPKVSLDASGKTGRDWGGVRGSQSDLYVGVQMEWAVFAGGAERHAKRAAEELEIATRHAYERARQELQGRVSTAWFELMMQSNSLTSFSEYAKNADAMVDASRKQFRIGRRSLLDVLNAENELFTARSNLVSAEQDRLKACYRLLSLQGQLLSVVGL